MYLTVGWYYKVISMSKIMKVVTFVLLVILLVGFLFFLMKFVHIMTPEMIQSLTALVHKRKRLIRHGTIF